MRRLRLFLLSVLLGLALSVPVRGQPLPAPDADSLTSTARASVALQDAKRTHLWRVAAWGGVNVLGGLALAWGTSRSRRSAHWHFGAMSSGWGAVNVGIATAGLLAVPDAPLTEPGAVLAAERQFHDVLLFNLGLNVAYAAVGGTMLGAGYRGVSNAGRWRGFGTALILQGAGLLVLDALAFFASRTRLADLVGPSPDLAVHALPSGLALTVPL
jgi:hypothetical protein